MPEIKYQVTGDAAQGTAAIQQFGAAAQTAFQKTAAAAAAAGTAATAATAAHSSLGSSAKLTFSSFKVLEGVATSVGFQVMPQVTMSLHTAAAAVKAMKAANVELTASFATITTGVVGLAAAIAAAAVAWSAYRAEKTEAASKTSLDEQSAAFALKLGQQVDALLEKDRISLDEADKLHKLLRKMSADNNEAVREFITDIESGGENKTTAFQKLLAGTDLNLRRTGLAGEATGKDEDRVRALADQIRMLGAQRNDLRDAMERGSISQAQYDQLEIQRLERINELVKRKTDLEQESERKAAALRQTQWRGVNEMFGNMAAAAKSFGKAGMAAYKTFAIAQATMDTYASAVAAYKSVVGIPYIGPVLAPIAAAAAIAAGLAQIAAIRSQGFMSGGYTGDGAPGEVAGAVHRGEWVMPADTVRAWGMANMAAIQQGQSPAGGSSTVNQTIAMFFDPYEMANRMRDAMNPIMLRATSGAQFRWRI